MKAKFGNEITEWDLGGNLSFADLFTRKNVFEGARFTDKYHNSYLRELRSEQC